jgi:hypothetical protein
MTSLQRAAEYLKKIGPKVALAIVPLAAAIPSHGSIVFDYTSGSWNQNAVGQSPFGGPGTNTGNPLAGTQIQGVSLIGAYNLFTSGGQITLTANWFGDGTGSTIPFPNASVTGFWMFSVDEGGAGDPVNWNINYTINGTLYPNVASGTLTGDDSVNSSGPVPVPIGDNLTSWSVDLVLFWDGVNGGPTDVTVQGIGIEAEDIAAVPEPGAFWLVTPLAAGLLFFRGRRRKS